VFPENWLFDTCQAEYTLTGVKNNDLTYLTGEYTPEYFGYDAEVNALGGAHKLRDKKKLMDYGANDVAVLWPIRKKQYKMLAKRNCLDYYENIMMPANRVLTKMSLRGVAYDLKKIMEVDVEYAEKADKALQEVLQLESVKECEAKFNQQFNPRSYPMVSWLLLKYYNLPVIKTTKTSDENPSVGKVEMERYAEDYNNEYCEKMLKYRSIQTIRNNFLSGVIPKLTMENDVPIGHTTYSLHATATGRPNSKNPNLLNIPRDKNVKRCIVARPGYTFVYSDEAQLEVRVSSVIYNEPKLIEISNDFSKDIHSALTAEMFGYKYEEVYDNYKKGDVFFTELRVTGKTIQFGILYGMGPSKLAYQLQIPQEDAKEHIATYFKRFNKLKENIDLTKQDVLENGYVDNYFNFRRVWPDDIRLSDDQGVVQAMIREAVNFKIQSVGFVLLELAMIKIDELLEKYRIDAALVLQVYDSVVVEARDNQVKEVAKIVKDVMQSVNESYENINRVKLKSDTEFGPNLADLEKIA
jgi:DNA polymerase-1